MTPVQAQPALLSQGASTDETHIPPRAQAISVTKRFNNRAVIRPLDLSVGAGERLALLGPNGAGKTTLLRILATLSRPSSGTVLVDGYAADRDAREVRRRVGLVAHQPYLYEDLTAGENLRFFARMYDVPEAVDRIAEVLEMVGLTARRGDRVRTFSRGMQQRLSIARAILHRPMLLLLDEPDSGLDREGIRVLSRLLAQQAAGGGSVLMTTHDIRFGLESSDRVLLMEHGRIVIDRPAGELDELELDERLATRS